MDEFVNDDSDAEETSEDDDKPKPWTADTSSDEESETKRKQRRRVSDSDDSSSSDGNDELPTQVPVISTSRTTRNSLKNIKETKPRNTITKNETDDDTDDKDSIVVVKPVETKGTPQRGSLRSGINFKDASENPDREVSNHKLGDFETEWYDKFLIQEDENNIDLSGKLVLLLEILANADVVGDKVLVFSQSLISLDVIESALGGGNIDGNEIDWCHGVDYFRMDGSTPVHRRKRWADIFNDPENDKYLFINVKNIILLIRVSAISVFCLIRQFCNCRR